MARKSTAENARLIDAKLLEAADHVRNAMRAYADVIEAIKTGENEPEFKLPEIQDLLGTSRTLARATIHAELPWSGYADARESKI
jgi:hypothetical protein